MLEWALIVSCARCGQAGNWVSFRVLTSLAGEILLQRQEEKLTFEASI